MSTIAPSPSIPSTPGLADIIGYVETKNDPLGYRFEPALWQSLATPSSAAQDILATIQHVHNCSLSSAKAIFASSFGEQQILAENLYAPQVGLKVTVFEFCMDQVLQAAMFDAFIKWKNLVYAPQDLVSQSLREHFALIYNGSLAYADLIQQALDHYGIR